METSAKKGGNSRVEFRVSSEDKELFEYAKTLMGYTSFSEFVRHILTKESKAIIEEKNRILSSERDKEIFFNALMGKEEPVNNALVEAINYHKKLIKKQN